MAVKAATFGIGDRLSACNAACSARAASSMASSGKLPQGGTSRDPVRQRPAALVCHAGTGIWRGITGNIQRRCTVRAMACGLKSVDDALPLRSGDKQ